MGNKTPEEGSSTMAEWRLQIYLVSDRTLQELIAGLLAGMDSIVVEAASSDFDDFLIVESATGQEADEVHRFIRAVDPDVKLVHTTSFRPVEPSAT